MLVVGPAAVTFHPVAFLLDDRPAVIKDGAVEIHRRRVFHQVRMDGIASGVHASRDQNDVANFQRANRGLVERGREMHLASRSGETFLIDHRNHRSCGIAVEPLSDGPVARVETHTEPPKCPAVIGDRYEKAGRQPIEDADLAANEADIAAEPHRADAQGIYRAHDRGLELRQTRVGIHVIERSEQLLLRVQISGRPIPADAHAYGAGRAPLSLRVPYRVKNAFPDTFEVAVCATQVGQLGRAASTGCSCSRSRRLSRAASPQSHPSPIDRSG